MKLASGFERPDPLGSFGPHLHQHTYVPRLVRVQVRVWGFSKAHIVEMLNAIVQREEARFVGWE